MKLLSSMTMYLNFDWQVTTDKKRRLVMLGGGTKERAAVVKLLTGWRSYQGKDQVITATHTR